MAGRLASRQFSSMVRARALGLVAALTLAAGSSAHASSHASPCARDHGPDPRAVIAAAEALPPHGIDELRTVRLGGIPQWVSIRGADPSNPILLFLHGGPGSPMMPESWTFERPWEDFFTVVQWDQRDAGKTFSAAHRVPDKSLSMDEMQSDAEQLIGWLRQRYGKRKIYLLGFSFGSILGLRIALHHPDWLYAYIGVGQAVNGYRNEVVSYQETLAKAEAVHDETAIKSLKSLAPYPSPKGPTPLSKIVTERQWVVALGGMRYGRSKDDSTAIYALSPDYNRYDVKSVELGELSSLESLVPQIYNLDFDHDRSFKCPIFFFAGADDRTTPMPIVAAYYKTISAPVKKFFLIKHAAHYVVNEAPGEVLMDLVEYVRPLSQAPTGPR